MPKPRLPHLDPSQFNPATAPKPFGSAHSREADPCVRVVEDSAIMRQTLLALVESAGLEARGFASAQTFLEKWDPSWCGCHLFDVRMPGISGIGLFERLRHADSCVPVIFITGYADVQTAVELMKAGAFDYIEKPFSGSTLLETVNRALRTDERRRQRHGWETQVRAHIESLTGREKQVLDLVVAGRLNKQIARDLAVSQKAVEAIRNRLRRKLHVETTADLIRIVTAYECSN